MTELAAASSTTAPSTEAPKTDSAPSANVGSAPAGGHQSPIEKQLASAKQPAEAPKTESPEAPKEKPKYKMKVNGKEAEYDIDTIIRKAQLAESADSKYQEAATYRKQVEQFMGMLQSDPMSLLTHPDLGLNFEELATNFLSDKIKRETMDPKDLELEELRNFKRKQDEDRQTSAQKAKQEAEEREFETLKTRAAQEYDRKISDVMSKSGLPKTPYAVKRIAEVLYGAQKKGYELDVNTAVDMVRESYLTDIQALVGGLDGDALLQILGADTGKKIQKHNIAQLQARLNPPAAPQSQDSQAAQQAAPKAAPKPSQEKLSPDDWREMIRRKAGL